MEFIHLLIQQRVIELLLDAKYHANCLVLTIIVVREMYM